MRKNEMSITRSRDSLGVLHNGLSCILKPCLSSQVALLDYKKNLNTTCVRRI